MGPLALMSLVIHDLRYFGEENSKYSEVTVGQN